MTTNITSGTCGCYSVDGEQKLWCAHHVSGLQETIKARDASIARYSIDLREARKKRDEWKAKAESALEQAERYEQEANALQDAVEHLREQIPDNDQDATIRILRRQKRAISQFARRMKAERDEWKAKAERKRCPCEFDGIGPCGQNCTCAYPMMSGGCERCATHGSEDQRQLMAGLLADMPNQVAAWKAQAELAERQVEEMRQVQYDMEAERDKLRRENDALQDAVEHLREQIPDNDQDMSSNATHYCCMHQRWETREGAEA